MYTQNYYTQHELKKSMTILSQLINIASPKGV